MGAQVWGLITAFKKEIIPDAYLRGTGQLPPQIIAPQTIAPRIIPPGQLPPENC